jgi:ectoine hydroxylase-related dioxygenase (phytanoyl-CoA dioxygenase family)
VLEMTERERFLFDVQGFLMVPGFLSAREVGRLNQAVDANEHKIVEDSNANIAGSSTLAGTAKRRILNDLITLDHPWCDPFRDLLAHPKLLPYLNTLLGPGWRMDHAPALFVADQGAAGLAVHGATGRSPAQSAAYAYANGKMQCGLVAVEFCLTPHDEGEGGFAVIAGSHKANFPVPPGIKRWEEDREIVRNPACDEGDALFFTEATLHGTLPWRPAHQRRALLYRYSPGYLHIGGGYSTTTLPAWADELTDAQRAVLEPPHVYSRPAIQDDGETVRLETIWGQRVAEEQARPRESRRRQGVRRRGQPELSPLAPGPSFPATKGEP